jgi:hypothetical protein
MASSEPYFRDGQISNTIQIEVTSMGPMRWHMWQSLNRIRSILRTPSHLTPALPQKILAILHIVLSYPSSLIHLSVVTA